MKPRKADQMMRKLGWITLLPVLSIALGINASRATVQMRGPIWNGPELDYQPAILRVQPGGVLLIGANDRAQNPVSPVEKWFTTWYLIFNPLIRRE